MSNIPSLPDLETDEISLSWTEGFRTKLDRFQNESEDTFVTAKRVLTSDSPSEGKAEVSKVSLFGMPDSSEEEIGGNLADNRNKQKTLAEIHGDLCLSVTKNEHESVSDISLDNGPGTPVTASLDVHFEKTSTDGTLIPLLDEFTISEADDAATGNDVIDSPDDWDELESTDEDGDTLLHQAIILENSKLAVLIIKIMARTGYDLNERNLLFQTPLHLAVLTGQMNIADELVANGADISARDRKGRTPFHMACEMRKPELVCCILSSKQRLLESGDGGQRPKSDNVLDLKNYDGEGCIHIAAKCGDIDLMKCLTKYCASVNLADEKSGRTALHFASESNDIDMVTYLLGINGINPSPETFSEETPVLLAYLRDFDEIVEIFKRKKNN